MSQENVDLVRRTIDLFNKREISRALEEVSDDFEMDWSNSIGPLKGISRGRQEVLKRWASYIDAWDAVRWEPEEFIEVDEERLIVVVHAEMRGRASGVPVEATAAQLWTFSDGRGQRIKLYQSKAEALKAVGLSE